jgi:hypothetical protein
MQKMLGDLDLIHCATRDKSCHLDRVGGHSLQLERPSNSVNPLSRTSDSSESSGLFGTSLGSSWGSHTGGSWMEALAAKRAADAVKGTAATGLGMGPAPLQLGAKPEQQAPLTSSVSKKPTAFIRCLSKGMDFR